MSPTTYPTAALRMTRTQTCRLVMQLVRFGNKNTRVDYTCIRRSNIARMI